MGTRWHLRAACAAALLGCAAPSHPAPPPPRPAATVVADPLGARALLADVAWLTDRARGGRGAGAGADATAAWLEGELRAAGFTVTTQPVPPPAAQRNVIAIWPGAGPAATDAPATRAPAPASAAPARAILVIAHYDHLGIQDGQLYPGADDNASGVAVALGVARDLARRRHLRRPVVFLFSAGEELGLLGAQAYAAAPAWPLDRTRAAINLDMVGRHFFERAVDRDAAVGAVGLGDDPVLAAAAERAAARVGIALVRASPALLLAIGESYRGDDWAVRRPGLPALHLSTGMHDDYHQATDDLSRLVPAQLERVARLVAAVLVEIDPEGELAGEPGR